MTSPLRYPIGQNMQPVPSSYASHVPQVMPGPVPGSVVVTVMRPPGGPPLMQPGSLPMVPSAMSMIPNSTTLGAVQVEFGGGNPGPPPAPMMLPSGPSSSLIATNQRINSDLGKCKSFLETLLKLASAPNQPQDMHLRVRALVQDIVNDAINATEFTTRLEVELRGNPQPQLGSFLQRTMPAFRQAMASGRIQIQGIQPPVLAPPIPQDPQAQMALASPTGGLPPQAAQIYSQQPSVPPSLPQLRAMQLPPSHPGFPPPQASQVRPPHPVITQQQQQPAPSATALASQNAAAATSDTGRSSESAADSAPANDLLGVGVSAPSAEEAARLSNAQKESMLHTAILERRIGQICARENLSGVSETARSLAACALQSRVRDALEHLSVVVSHRLHVYRNEAGAGGVYEPAGEVKQQLRVLEELDRAEQRTREESERTAILRAAKSRSKVEDPEQIKLKQRAKEMQMEETEAKKQRDANITALAAIGPRRKLPRLDQPAAAGAAAPDSPAAAATPAGASDADSQASAAVRGSKGGPTMPPSRAQMRRVTMRDAIFVLERLDTGRSRGRGLARRQLLYRAMLADGPPPAAATAASIAPSSTSTTTTISTTSTSKTNSR